MSGVVQIAGAIALVVFWLFQRNVLDVALNCPTMPARSLRSQSSSRHGWLSRTGSRSSVPTDRSSVGTTETERWRSRHFSSPAVEERPRIPVAPE